MSIESMFVAVNGRAATPEETARFRTLSMELGIRDNDAVWPIVFLIGHYTEIAHRLPEQMQKKVAGSLNLHRDAMELQVNIAASRLQQLHAGLEEAFIKVVADAVKHEIAHAAQAVATNVARKSLVKWLGSSALAGMLLLGAACWSAYFVGERAGFASSLTVKEAESWAATPEGQAAYQMERNGDLQHLQRCDQDGWKVMKTASGKKGCFVGEAKDGEIRGWLLP